MISARSADEKNQYLCRGMTFKRYRNIIFGFLTLFVGYFNTGNAQNTLHKSLDERFLIYKDTVVVNIRGEMTHALKYQDKFYVLFKEQELASLIYGGYEIRRLYIFSKGKLEKTLDCPPEMKTVYLDFYVNNDSIILKPYMDEQCYALNLSNYKWIEIDKTDDLIFEDDKYWVYSKDFGEWGGKTWFKDKKTGKEYELEETTPLVNKIGTTYYLTTPFSVLKIENPLLLNKCDSDVTYENIELTEKAFCYGKSVGYEVIYIDTTVDEFDFSFWDAHIISSFVWKNELLHIYKTKNAVYIAKIENKSIKTIQKIAGNIECYDYDYSYRCKNLNGNNELLKFKTNNRRKFGLMEVVDNKVFIHYFINKAQFRPKVVGYKKANDISIKRLDFILNDFSHLKLEEIDSKEQSWNSFDVTPTHKVGIGNSWNPNNYTINANKSYLIKESAGLSNIIMYYAIKKDSLVKAVTIDWEYREKRYRSRKTLDYKIQLLKNYVKQKGGKQMSYTNTTKELEIIWEMPSNMILDLTYSKIYYEISLVIYEKGK